MKKLFIGVAALPLLALLATSCAEETIETKTEDGKFIAYGVAAGKQTLSTRAELSLTELMNDTNGFETYVNIPAGTPWNSYDVIYNANPSIMEGWKYNGGIPLLHPNFDLSHYALYPERLSTLITAGSATLNAVGSVGQMDITYTVEPANPSIDLIAASDKTEGTNATTAKALFTFQHILSQINFAVKGPKDFVVTVNNIQIKNVNKTGDYKIPDNGFNSTYLGNISNTWTNLATPDTYTYPYSKSFPTNNTAYDPLAVTAVSNTSTVYLTSDGLAPGAANTNGLMLIPQSLSYAGGTFDDTVDPHFVFDYQIGWQDGSKYYELANGGGRVTVPFGDTDLGTVSAWVPGRRYLYVINFETPIIIKYNVVDVGTWTDIGPINLDVDNNKNGQASETNDDETGDTEYMPGDII